MTNEDIEHVLEHVATKADLADLRTEIHKEFHAQTWKLIGLIMPVYALIIALLITLIGHLK